MIIWKADFGKLETGKLPSFLNKRKKYVRDKYIKTGTSNQSVSKELEETKKV